MISLFLPPLSPCTKLNKIYAVNKNISTADFAQQQGYTPSGAQDDRNLLGTLHSTYVCNA